METFVSDIKEDISTALPSHLVIKNFKTLWSSEEAHAVAARRKLFVIEENRKHMIYPANSSIGIRIEYVDPSDGSLQRLF